MKKRGGRFVVVITVVLSVAVISYVVLNLVFSPYWDSVYPPFGYMSFASMRNAESDSETFSHDNACADIDYIVKRLNRVHPAYSDGVPENIVRCAEEQKNSFGNEVSAYELWRAAARILHETGDPQCICAPSFSMHYLNDFSNNLQSGCKLTAVNGEKLEDIFSGNKNLLSYQLEPWGINITEGLCGTREGLKFLGIYSDDLEYTYVFPDGSTVTKTYNADDFYNFQAAENLSETPDAPYSSEILKSKNTAVLTLDSCAYDSDFKEFIYSFFNDVNSNNISNIILDLRDTNGGSSQVLDEILMYLDHDSFKTPGGDLRLGPYTMHWDSEETKIIKMDVKTIYTGRLYVLTSYDTFGSGTLVAAELKDNGFALTAGEPCGDLPECYGDVAAFQTPNSAITFQIPTKHFERIDQTKADEPLLPDYPCEKQDALLTVLDIISENK